ncbi:excinuclease ABC, B subunit [Desulfarculus baarsii DSM 2075]|uniref:UvrABC system protein B n=1 Tax=Desulfarculus baarsii (strain ATCC 33931 / DSM 2075 / LMG 7858 / VKM B-1802 / 2st14) TaxID=644282 RepID=E1QDX7_DESB2|nr:excinuclease ABC subunit UvrB [Desulfarculus baarsii]ADK83763.1 excinuclease ABC, B subunit [Desulfarculus baarsii DSM 2075]
MDFGSEQTFQYWRTAPSQAQFKLESDYQPQGDQPQAIAQLTAGLAQGCKRQVLLGVTGSGKTFTMANVIAASGLTTLVLAPNKTLAAQLYGEFKALFPHNAVEYFVSYYDYYQPEAYIPASDTYIEKDSSINERIDKMRHAATFALLTRQDVIIVASVSCIYGLGSPEAYAGMLLYLQRGDQVGREAVLRKLVEMLYERNEFSFHRGVFRARGDVVEIFPAYEEERAVRIEFFGDEVERISFIDPLRGVALEQTDKVVIFPASHYVTTEGVREAAIAAIRAELAERIKYYDDNARFIESQRIRERTLFDIEMMKELGWCHGIENYSRHLTGRQPGQPPPTLLDYFPKKWLLIIDESHITAPQVRGMYNGDRSRKATLVDFGFRLPSALDNRPLNFDEFNALLDNVIYVSATPADYELEQAQGVVVEQLIRPTGLIDPIVEVRPASGQVDDVMAELRLVAGRGERALVTTLTKRMAEELTEYLTEVGLSVKYLHSDIDTIARVELLQGLRRGDFDILVGINLLREGLDLPEVSLVAILDADREGFLRSTRSLIQTAGRAARNVGGKVIFYADQITDSIARAMEETSRRRVAQEQYNQEHGITPESIKKAIGAMLPPEIAADYPAPPPLTAAVADPGELPAIIADLRRRMKEAAKGLRFEEAAELRDQIKALEEQDLLWRG